MRALVLAGGKATRLRPLTERTPKAMTPVLGRPFLEHVLAWLRRHDVLDVTLLLGFLPEPIRAYFRDGHEFGVKLTYVVEEEPLGSGGAIKQIESELTEPFLVLNADIFTDLDLTAMIAAHNRAGGEVSIALTRVEDPSQYGVVEVDTEGWIRRFVEKPNREEAPSNLINAGVWLFEPSALGRIASGVFTMVEQDLFPALAREHRLYGYDMDAYWMDAGTPERYLQLQRDMLAGHVAGALALIERPGWPGVAVQPAGGQAGGEGRAPHLTLGTVLDGPVVLGERVRTGDGCRLEGPVTIGARTELEARVEIRDSVLWEDCRIGEAATIVSSVLAGGCVVGAGAVVEGCVLGEGARVRPGTRLIAARLNPGETA
ncbi:MAG: sugar phosphate nucleotidyltransferase [Dehalococcoidia bacterium]